MKDNTPKPEITSTEFDDLLIEYVNEQPAANLLCIEGVYGAVASEYNDAILDRWKERQQ